MPFSYVASTKGGTVKRGTSDLASKAAVIQSLESKGLIVVSVENVGKSRSAVKIASYLLGTVSHVEKVLVTKHLSVMLKAGLTLIDALRILGKQTRAWQMRIILKSVIGKVEQGERFSDGLAEFPAVFSPFFVNVVRAGEISGTLEGNLENLATQYTKEHELLKKVRTALLYPTIVIVAAAFIGFFFATYVLPQVAALFGGLKGIELPWTTRALLAVSGVVKDHTFLTFTGLVVAIFGTLWLLKRKFLQPITHVVALRMPILGKIIKDVNLARFALILHTLLQSGIDITRALEITESVLGNFYYERSIGKFMADVQRGKTLSKSLASFESLYPPIVSQMVMVGERAGRLEEVLGYLAEFYELEVETSMKNLTTVLEPVLLLLIGGVALALAFSILIPIYNFINAIGSI
jgi:type IV pilus assembly protein PilC